MIQRIQSLHLLFAAIFMAIFAFAPYMTLSTPNADYRLTTTGLETIASENAITVSTQNYTLAILSLLTALLSLITIFLFKNRKLQVLVCRINLLLYITLYIVMILYGYFTYTDLHPTTFATTTYVIFPVCAIIVNSLAISGIQKDERMVKDSERMWSRKN